MEWNYSVVLLLLINGSIALFAGKYIIQRSAVFSLRKWQHPFQSIKPSESYVLGFFRRIPFDIIFGINWSHESIFLAYLVFLLFMLWIIMQFCLHSLLFILTGVILCLMPLVILENGFSRARHHIDNNFLGLMHALHAGLLNTEDVIGALDHAEMIVEDIYITRMLRKFNKCIKMGLSEHKAFEQLREDSCHVYLSYVFMNIEQVYQRRGNIIRLIENLQLEYTAIQIEINKRKVELRQEKMFVVICLCMMLGVVIGVQWESNYIWEFYQTHHLEGFLTVTIITTVLLTLYVLVKSDHLRY